MRLINGISRALSLRVSNLELTIIKKKARNMKSEPFGVYP